MNDIDNVFFVTILLSVLSGLIIGFIEEFFFRGIMDRENNFTLNNFFPVILASASYSTFHFIKILKNLKELGNSVLVVEHDEDIIRAADEIIDLGPGAGSQGGNVIAQGSINKLLNSNSLTVDYLTQNNLIEIPSFRRKSSNKIKLRGCRENNLKNINVDIPLNSLVCITGISGSGKTTLVKKILYPSLLKQKGIFKEKPVECYNLSGNLESITSIEYIDQNPIGTSSRSNPATYIKAYDDIRTLFSNQKSSRRAIQRL